jgi:hypothetical protein
MAARESKPHNRMSVSLECGARPAHSKEVKPSGRFDPS